MNGFDAVLKTVSDRMTELGLTYAYDGYDGTPAYPYFVGSYAEQMRYISQGRTIGTFTVRGWGRDRAQLQMHLGQIREAFKNYAVTDDETCVVMDMGSLFGVRSEPGGLKTMEAQIHVRTFEGGK